MLLHDSFETAAHRRPEHVALICRARRVTYWELLITSRRLANFLRDAGLRDGDRVALCLHNGVELVVGILATMMAGGVFVVVNPGVKAGKLDRILGDSSALVLVTESEWATVRGSFRTKIVVGAPADAQLAAGDHDYHTIVEATSDAELTPSRTDDDLCCLVYTSGSTGGGKGVMMTHRNTTFAADTISDYLRLTEDDVVLNFTPMAADYGLYNVLMPLRRGATSVLERGYVLPSQILDHVAAHGVTGLAVVPTIIAMFLQTKGLDGHDLDRVRFLSTTGQALPTAHFARLRELMPGCAIYSMYGLTECKRVSFLDPELIDRRPDSVGKAMAGTEVWLVGEDDRRLELPSPGARAMGELVVEGDHVMRGYWNLPEETAACLRPGSDASELVLYSGDYFEMDADGLLYFLSRKDDLIKSSAERVSPREVEDCIFALPGVTGVVVSGVPDDILGAAVHALVAVDAASGLNAHRIRAHCADHLEQALVPKHIELCDAIPQTLSGKLTKRRP